VVSGKLDMRRLVERGLSSDLNGFKNRQFRAHLLGSKPGYRAPPPSRGYTPAPLGWGEERAGRVSSRQRGVLRQTDEERTEDSREPARRGPARQAPTTRTLLL